MTIVTLNILLVDDFLEDRETYRRYLLREKQHKYRILEASTGEQALLLCQQQFPDVIVTDYLLPDIDGLEFLDNLKTQFGQTNLPVIILTGQGNEQIAVQAMKGGAADYLVKKNTTQLNFIKAIKNVLEKTHLTRQLEESEGRFQATFNQAAVGIAHVGLDGKWLLVNQKLCDIVGYSREELLTLTFEDITHPDDLNLDLEYVVRMLTGEIKTYSVEKRYIRQDNTQIWINLTVSLVDSASGEPQYFICVIEDITVRKQTQAALQQAHSELERRVQQRTSELQQANQDLQITLEELQVFEEELREQNEELARSRQAIELERQHYQDLFEFAPDGYLVTDTWGNIREANSVAATLLCLQQKHLIGKPLLVYIFEPERKAFRTRLANLQQVQDWETYLKPRSGDPFPVMLAVTSIYDEQGQQVGWRWLLRDIRLRKQMEQRLQAAHDELEKRVEARTAELARTNTLLQQKNELLQAIFDHIPVMICLFDANGHFQWANREWETVLGWGVADIQGRDLLTEFYPDPEYRQHVLDFIAAGERRWSEFKTHTRDGRILDTTWASVHLRDGTTIGIGQDISDRARAEAALRHNQEMFSALVENAPFGIYLIDAEFRLLQINQGSKAAFSNIDPLIGRDFAEIVRIIWQEPFTTEVINRFRHTLATGESYYSPTIIEPRANIEEIQAYDWQIHRITLPDGSYGVVCYFYDLSEIKRNEEIIRRTAQRDAFLITLSDALRPLADPVEIQAIASRILGEYLGANRALYFEVRGSDYVVERGYVNGADALAGIYPIDAFGQSLIAAYRSGHTVVQPDISADPNLSPDQQAAYAAIEIAAHIGIPLIKDGEFVAGLAVHMAEPRVWTQDEVTLASEVADRTWAAVERARAEAVIAADLKDTQLLHDLSARLISEDDIQVLYNEIVATAIALTKADAGTVQILDEATQELVLLATQGFDRTMIEHFYRVTASSNTSCGIALATNTRTFVDFDVPNSPDPDGSLRMDVEVGYISAQSTPLISHSGKPIGMVSTHWRKHHRPSDRELRFLDLLARQAADLIEQRQAQEKIREQAALLDVATDAILVRDLARRTLYWNSGAERMYGWQAAEVLNKDCREFLYKEISPSVQEALTTVVEQGKWHGELNKTTKSGQKIIVSSRWTLVRDETGQPKSILTVDTDITEKKQLEQQFYRAQRLESLGTLASGIAHDLNNILTPILTVAQLLPLKFPNLDQQNRELLKILESSSKRGAQLVKQILSFARGAEGKLVPLQPKHLLKEIEQVVKSTFPKSIEIRTQIATLNLWAVLADPTQIHQVLMNLCVNARDAMPNGGILSISAENFRVDQNYARMNLEANVGDYVLITVSDTGCGIPQDVLERIFEPFFTTKEPGKGTGLGLATVIGIIKNHGGFVNVYSEVGKGSQFQLYLRAIDTSVTQEVDDFQMDWGNGELILVVDDEALVRDVAKTSLEEFNYRVLIASDGVEAFSLYVRHKDEISVVLMDIQMPSIDGLNTIRVLQRMNPKVKIIAISGLKSNQKLLEAAGIHVQAFLSKPYTIKELLETIKGSNRPLGK